MVASAAMGFKGVFVTTNTFVISKIGTSKKLKNKLSKLNIESTPKMPIF
jgi:hypothetical protein